MTSRYPLLALMLADMESAPALYRPTPFWSRAVERIVAELETGGVENFRRLESTLGFFVPTYGAPGWPAAPGKYEPVLEALRGLRLADRRQEMLLKNFLSGEAQAYADYRVYWAACDDRPLCVDRASESELGRPVEQFEFGGARFSRSMLNYLLGLCFLKRHVETRDIRSVMEIGGGYGTLGEILLGDDRNDVFYLDADIPPTAFAATWYLQERFGKDLVAAHDALREESVLDLDTLREKYRAAVIGPWLLPRVRGRLDLFVNFISFQEMEPEVVRNYLAEANRLESRYVLLRNLREGKNRAKSDAEPGVRQPIRGGDYDKFLPGYRLRATNVEPFGFKTVDGFHSELRLYARTGKD